MSNQLERHRVAVTVFLEADGLGAGDAHNVAEQAVADALNAAGGTLTTHTYTGLPRTARVVEVMGTGTAFANGLLRVEPAASVYQSARAE